MGNNYKLVAFDLDGTVLEHGGDITPATVTALRRAHDAGAIVAVSTGRPDKMIPDSVKALPFLQYIISASGAVIFDVEENRVISERYLPREMAETVMRVGKEGGASFNVFLTDRRVFEWRSMLMMWRMWRPIRKQLKGKPLPRRFKKLRPPGDMVWNAEKAVLQSTGSVIKINCIYRNAKQCSTELERFLQMEGIEPVTTMENDIEITATGATKGEAIAFLCEMLDIGREDVLVFGDSGNDLSMREYAGAFVAMGNASEDVKAVADHVTGTVGDDGVAMVLHKLYGLDEDSSGK